MTARLLTWLIVNSCYFVSGLMATIGLDILFIAQPWSLLTRRSVSCVLLALAFVIFASANLFMVSRFTK